MTHHARRCGTRGWQGKRGVKSIHWRHSRRGKSYWWALEMRGQLDPLRSYLVLLRIRGGQAAPERGLHKTEKQVKTWLMISVAKRNLPTPLIVFIQSGIVSSSNIPPSSSSVMLTWTNKSDI